MSAPSQWQGILDEGEEILWQGRPEDRIQFKFGDPAAIMMSAFIIIFSVFWMYVASQGGGFFWMFGLLFLGIGLYRLIGVHFGDAYQRRQTFYTLTNQHAFIARKELLGRKRLDSYPITPDIPLRLEEGRLTSIYFAKDAVKRIDGSEGSNRIGFELLKDGRDVYGIMRKIQTSGDIT